MTLAIQAEAIKKDYATRGGALPVLEEASLRLDRGEAVVIMGPSGCGKSTLLAILGTLETPDAGKVSIEGTDPFALSPNALARFRNRRIGFVFQDHHLLPQCSVLENVLLPTLAERGDHDGLARAQSLLARVGLTARLDHRPAELSGGERQRAAVARAMINRPALLLADEPTGNLDRRSAQSVADLLLELPRDDGTALIVVTHSTGVAERFSKRFELTDGKLAPA